MHSFNLDADFPDLPDQGDQENQRSILIGSFDSSKGGVRRYYLW
jgi:hypothetical protein